MAADEHHGGVLLGGLLLADGADEDGVVDHGAREGRLKGELVLRRPLRLLLLHVGGVLDQPGQGDGAGRDGDVERGLGGEAEEGAELAGECEGDVVKRRVVAKEVPIGRLLEVGRVDHGGGELRNLLQVATLKPGKVPSPIVEGTRLAFWRAVQGVSGAHGRAFEEPDELQLAELKLEVAPPLLEPGAVGPRPVDGGDEVGRLELGEDLVHFRELALEVLTRPGVHVLITVLVCVAAAAAAADGLLVKGE